MLGGNGPGASFVAVCGEGITFASIMVRIRSLASDAAFLVVADMGGGVMLGRSTVAEETFPEPGG